MLLKIISWKSWNINLLKTLINIFKKGWLINNKKKVNNYMDNLIVS